jgi:hypothetical protein
MYLKMKLNMFIQLYKAKSGNKNISTFKRLLPALCGFY